MDKYEKLYNEALERARKIHNEILDNEILGFPDQIREIFPELREPEDERIRKELIDFLRSPFIKENLTDEKVAPWLDWLEKQECGEKGLNGPQEIGDWRGDEGVCKKQKEQKPSIFPPGLGEVHWNPIPSAKKELVEKPADEQFPPLEGLDAIKAKYYDDGFKNGFDEGVESVKPAEWSEEEALNRAYEEGFNDGLKYREPANRSDEDRKMAHWLIGLVNANTELSFSDKTNLTRWLEHLTIEKELSKNDKRIMDAIMIGYQDKDFRSSQIPTPIGVSKDEVIAWLKSLRPQPHWKPSEEHLSALLAVFNDPNNIGSQTCQLALTDLYEQLKKL